jgi:hypothetical protein
LLSNLSKENSNSEDKENKIGKILLETLNQIEQASLNVIVLGTLEQIRRLNVNPYAM